MDHKIKHALQKICPDGFLDSEADRIAYSYDAKQTGKLPALIMLPETEEQVGEILKVCSDYRIPVVPRGAATGTTGAVVPQAGWLVLGLSRMNRILKINCEDFTMRVQPGATTAQIQEAAEKVGLFYPPDPASAKNSTIGGNVATCAGGLRAVKYGVTRDYIMGLTAYRIGGHRLEAGVGTRKGVVGYDLTRLLIGSEGTLAVITEITLRLIALPEARRTILSSFNSPEDACRAVQALLSSPVLPDAIELLDAGTIEALEAYGQWPLASSAEALLIIEVDGVTSRVNEDAVNVEKVLRENQAVEIKTAKTKEESAALWNARRAVSPAVFALAKSKVAEDVAVPVSRLPELIAGVREIASGNNLRNVNYGHAGDGNLHVNLLLDGTPGEKERAKKAVSAIFDLTLSLGGTISGEHGVGITKRDYIARELDTENLSISRAIKRVFDPDNLLNPGKVFPEQ